MAAAIAAALLLTAVVVTPRDQGDGPVPGLGLEADLSRVDSSVQEAGVSHDLLTDRRVGALVRQLPAHGLDRGASLHPGQARPRGHVASVVVGRPSDPDRTAPPPSPCCEPRWVEAPLPATTPFGVAIEQAARGADIHPFLLAAVVEVESGFDPNAVSGDGACGLTQLMPAAASELGVRDIFDPAENLRGGAEYLRSQLDRFPSLDLALAAYNAGPTRVRKARGLPPCRETHRFVRRVMAVFCSDEASPADTPPPSPSLGSGAVGR